MDKIIDVKAKVLKKKLYYHISDTLRVDVFRLISVCVFLGVILGLICSIIMP